MKFAQNHFIYDNDVLIIGAGFYGLTIAHEISTRSDLKVLVLEKRDHLGGNAFSYTDHGTQIEIHKYGSHLFHTSNERVWSFVNTFTKFNSYRHTVKSVHDNGIYPFPINLHTINQFLGKNYSPKEAQLWMQDQISVVSQHPDNLEDQAISLVGEKLYTAFIKGYTMKQWQTDPKKLPKEIINRIPVRFDFNDSYFDDKYEGIPCDGYGKLFDAMTESGKFEVQLCVDFKESEFDLSRFKKVFYTGPIDRFFSYRLGVLGWRTIDFTQEVHDVNFYQGGAVVNYADENIPFTRIHEFKHLHPERAQSQEKTIICKEFSRFAGRSDEPYYPINSVNDRRILLDYRQEAKKFSNVVFGGRLGRYQYLDMHMAIAAALSEVDLFLEKSISFGSNK